MRTHWFVALFLTLVLLIAHAAPTLAGFEGGDSPVWNDAGRSNASDTAKAANNALEPGGRAADRANEATGIDSSGHPADHRR